MREAGVALTKSNRQTVCPWVAECNTFGIILIIRCLTYVFLQFPLWGRRWNVCFNVRPQWWLISCFFVTFWARWMCLKMHRRAGKVQHKKAVSKSGETWCECGFSSQHAAAVWWGRCSPFKLCLSPPVGHFFLSAIYMSACWYIWIFSYKMVLCPS